MNKFWQGITSDTVIAATAVLISAAEFVRGVYWDYFASAKLKLYLNDTLYVSCMKEIIPIAVYVELVNQRKLPIIPRQIIGIHKNTKEKEVITPLKDNFRKKLDYAESVIILLNPSVFDTYSAIFIEDTQRHKFPIPKKEIRKIKKEIEKTVTHK